MGRPGKSIIITLAITAATLVPLSQANSKDWGNRHYGNNAPSHGGFEQGRQRHERYGNNRHYGPKPGRRNYPVARSNNNDDALLLGILGLAAGAVIGGAILSQPPAQPSYNYEPRRSYAPNAAPNYYPPAPAPSYAQGGNFQPWSDNWYRYCAQKYRSFKAATGTYRGYDGQDHFCVAP